MFRFGKLWAFALLIVLVLLVGLPMVARAQEGTDIPPNEASPVITSTTEAVESGNVSIVVSDDGGAETPPVVVKVDQAQPDYNDLLLLVGLPMVARAQEGTDIPPNEASPVITSTTEAVESGNVSIVVSDDGGAETPPVVVKVDQAQPDYNDLLLLVGLPMVARAQEGTDIPPNEASPVITSTTEAVESGNVSIVVSDDGGAETPPVVVKVDQAQPDYNDLLLLLMPVLSALFGVLAGGGGVFYVLSRANENKPLKDSTERFLFESTPPQTLNIINKLALGAKQGAEFVASVTDGKPNG